MLRLLTLLALVAIAAPAAAQPSYFSPDQIDRLFNDEPKVEVNLRGSLLSLAAAATRNDEPETAALIEGLNAITVRVYELQSLTRSLTDNLSDIGNAFERDGWDPFVRVREDSTQAWIYVLSQGDAFGGMALMAVDLSDEQVAFVMIDGFIEPEMIGRLSSRFGNVDLDEDDDE